LNPIVGGDLIGQKQVDSESQTRHRLGASHGDHPRETIEEQIAWPRIRWPRRGERSGGDLQETAARCRELTGEQCGPPRLKIGIPRQSDIEGFEPPAAWSSRTGTSRPAKPPDLSVSCSTRAC
jgi:hypothetical protein